MSRNNKPPVVIPAPEIPAPEIPAPEIPDEQTLPVIETPESTVNEAPTVGNEQELPVIETPAQTPIVSTAAPAKSTHTMEFMPIKENETFKNPGDVDFVVHYPEAYKGDRNMEQDSTVVVSQEVADHFIKLGIGKIKK